MGPGSTLSHVPEGRVSGEDAALVIINSCGCGGGTRHGSWGDQAKAKDGRLSPHLWVLAVQRKGDVVKLTLDMGGAGLRTGHSAL